MKIRTHMRGQASLESVAITDIILNMFIFFFTSFSLVYTFNPARESRVQVKLPQADVRAPAAPREPIEVTIDARGQTYLQGKPIALGDLTVGVQALLAGDLSTMVIIRGRPQRRLRSRRAGAGGGQEVRRRAAEHRRGAEERHARAAIGYLSRAPAPFRISESLRSMASILNSIEFRIQN